MILKCKNNTFPKLQSRGLFKEKEIVSGEIIHDLTVGKEYQVEYSFESYAYSPKVIFTGNTKIHVFKCDEISISEFVNHIFEPN